MAGFSQPNARGSAGSAQPTGGGSMAGRARDPDVLETLGRQLALYEQLSILSHRQGGLIGIDDGAALLELIAQRQHIIDQLQVIQGEFESQRLASIILSESQRREAAELNELIAAIRARILEQDERDRAALRDLKAQVGAELRQLSTTGRAARVYGGGGTPSPALPVTSRFTDKQG